MILAKCIVSLVAMGVDRRAVARLAACLSSYGTRAVQLCGLGDAELQNFCIRG
jgi:hypothetical protein